MTDGRCGTCKYWTRAKWLPDTHGECGRINAIDSMETPTDIAVVTTDSAAGLVTMPTFGCVEWVHKDSPD